MRVSRWRIAAALVVLAALFVAPAAQPRPASATGLGEGATTNLWFVQLSGSPATFKSQAAAAGIKYAERYRFGTLWNGVSIRTDAGNVGLLRGLGSVEAVFPVLEATVDPVVANDPELATALAMTGADIAQSELGLTGEGVKVAIMDTGIDYNHADLGGSGTDGDAASDDGTFDGDFPNSRVVTGWDFVGDDFNASNPAKRTAAPDPDPDDCQGHGTHVAGIVGASGGVTGVAPNVEFGAYRVFGCTGSTTADIMLAAMERALEDGMHVLNMSIGSAFMTWPQYPTAAGADAAVEQGMVVVASIGNSGANGVYSAGAPGVGNKVIGVASFDNSHINALTFRTNPADTQVAYLQLSNTTAAPTSGTTPEVVWYGRGCTSLGDTPEGDVSGKVALIIRGDCTFNEKYQGAVGNGAVAVVIYNQFPGLFAGGGVVDRGVPGVGISNADGLKIRDELAAGPVTLTWTDERINAENPTGGRASSFTSYGLTAELKLKPNIGAPGGLIRSTYPLEKGTYAILSGTSMSSPHVAGAAALYLEAKPGTAPDAVKTAFQNSADPIKFGTSNIYYEVVHRQGAGMIDIDDAVLATTTVAPSEISLGEGYGGSTTLTVTNNGTSDVTYDLSHLGALRTFGSTNAPRFHLNYTTVTFSSPSVTVAAGSSATVDVTFSPLRASLFERSQYGGFVVLTPQGGGQSYSVPYAGFQGDYQSVQVLTSARCSLPGLFKLGGSTTCDSGSINGVTRVTDGATYSMTDGDLAYFLVHLEHQARSLEFTVVDAATGKAVSGKGMRPTFFNSDYLPRNSTATAFFAFTWDGTLTKVEKGTFSSVEVPEGDYKVVLSVLKALGDPSNPAHTETWTSPTITIDRP